MQHLSSALRQLRHKPGFSLTVILTLALSIGANTAIFSVVNAVLLRGLPYAHPEKLATLFARTTGAAPTDDVSGLDGEKWELLRDNVPSLLSAISSQLASGLNLQMGSRSQYLHDGRVSAHYFDVLSISPVLGRSFSLDEDRPHGPPAVILSYSLWKSAFASDASIIGRGVLLKGEPYTVIGVLPSGAVTPLNADIYTAIQANREGEGQGSNFEAIARLRDGASWQQADAELNRAWAVRAARFARSRPGAQVAYYAAPLQRGQTQAIRPQVLAAMLASGFILLIACANLAGLALVRILQREREFATRLALGATRWQIQRQLWSENLLLAMAGAIAGVGLGSLALRGLLALLPEHFLPVAAVRLDGGVLIFSVCAGLLTTVLFGVLPALTTRKIDLQSAAGGRAVAGRSSHRLRQGLIAGEVALTVTLLAASGLLIRTLIHLETLPPGFNPSHLVTAKASLDDVRYHEPVHFNTLVERSISSLREIPGVTAAAMGLSLPYERGLNDSFRFRDGPSAGRELDASEVYVSADYFATLQIPFLAGHAFTGAEKLDGQKVAIVNETFARKFYGKAIPIGSFLNEGTQIVGVVGNTTNKPGLEPGAPLASEETVYLPAAQMTSKALALVHVWFQPSWIVRTSGQVSGLSGQMQQALASADPNLPFSGFYSMNDLRAEALSTQRIEVALLTTMAALALLLSALGIFSLVANSVVERTREIGIRIALGSSIRQAMVHIGSSGVLASLSGLGLGLVLCAGVLRAMRSVIFGISPYDIPTLGAVVATLAAISLVAATAPASRIAKLDPVESLRAE